MRRDEIQHLLPEVFQRTVRPGNPLSAILKIMEELQEPSRQALQDLGSNFNPYRAPEDFVVYLAQWMDLGRLFDEEPASGHGGQMSSRAPITSGFGQLRELVAAAAFLSRWRGTKKGLLAFLEISTGEKGFEIQEETREAGGSLRPFHIRVLSPVVAQVHERLIARIIEQEKPAYVTYELEFSGDSKRKATEHIEKDAAPRTALPDETGEEKPRSDR